MQFCALASGSNGNCYYVGQGDARVLVDLGVSAKQAETALREIGVDPKSIRAVLITHEHGDHTRGVGVWARRYRVPILSTELTLQAVLSTPSMGMIPAELLYPIRAGKRYDLDGLKIEPFPLFHDAIDPVGYTLSTEGARATILTDTGMTSPEMEELLMASDLAVVESNYDPQMLMTGPYPLILKKRIRSNVGHLSNVDCGEMLKRVLIENPALTVLLGHLSEENNTPEIALSTVQAMVADVLAEEEQRIGLTKRGARTELFEFHGGVRG